MTVSPARAEPADDAGTELVGAAVDLVRSWLAIAEEAEGRTDQRDNDRFRRLTSDAGSVAFTMSFADRVLRPESSTVAAAQLRALVGGPLPGFLSTIDRALLRVGAVVSRVAPWLVMPLARRRLRQIVGGLVVDRDDPALGRHLRRLGTEGFAVNANLLGELVLGHREASRRRAATIELLRRDDVGYVSVKASSITSQLDLWGDELTLERVMASLREVLRAAAASTPSKFVNLDMEEYKDLRLTIDAFTRLLDEPELRDLEAGIVLQAYLPDAGDALAELTAWAQRRRAAGGAGIKVRIVKGANLAMERVDAAMHGWALAPYGSKAETDANFKRLLDDAFRPERCAAVRIGVASHNLFDVAWARLLSEARGVQGSVEFEMLQGMAPAIARTVRAQTGDLLLYTPIVRAADFDSALAYLFRRLEENSNGDNFLRHLFDLSRDPSAFAAEQRRFETAVAERWTVSSVPRADRERDVSPAGFHNVADTDPTDAAARRRILDTVSGQLRTDLPDLPVELDVAGIDRALGIAVAGAESWRSLGAEERRRLLHRAGDQIAERRAQLIAVMAHEAAKTVAEGDVEVSEAIDFAHYYAERIDDLGSRTGAAFEPLGVIAVVPPWNFPVAIPIGGALAALAAGNAVIVKPAPQTPRSALAVVEACWAAGIPRDALQYVRCPEAGVGEHLIAHTDLGGIVLTGSSETAELFAGLAPETPLFAETSGKNAVIVMPDADLDLAVADLVRSAFGHAGQKCSAASLAICVGDVATSERFRRQLADATQSLQIALADEPGAVMAQLIDAPSPQLRRALTEPEDGQRWLVEPRLLDPDRHLWSPGVLDGVRRGSWFHHTECFGPVLGLMAARDLDEAIALQNSTGFGLTGGIHSLDPVDQQRWLERVEVGNAYINRAITGAVVQRQPFGGWKRSVVGPGAKAGGPDYVAQLGRWTDDGLPDRGEEPSATVAALVDAAASRLTEGERVRLDAAVRSDAHWWRTLFGVQHDPTGLFCESNVLRYRPLPSVQLRVASDAPTVDVVRVVAALRAAGVPTGLSADPTWTGWSGAIGSLVEGSASGSARLESASAFASRVTAERPERIRLLGREATDRWGLGVATFVDADPPVLNGRVELLRYLREQSVSTTLHRFGNLVGAQPATTRSSINTSVEAASAGSAIGATAAT